MEDLVHEPDAGRFERVLVWKLHMYLPYATSKRCCVYRRISASRRVERSWGRTFRWPVEPDVEFLHAIVHESDFVVRHQPE
jgi:hypothetical protein